MKSDHVTLRRILFLSGMICVVGGCRQTGSPAAANRQAPALVSLQQRRAMNDRDRLRWLEGLGIVPEDAEDKDWQLAKRTSWWGKPIDAKRFWSGRTLWNDRATQRDAMRLGRWHPPIPDGREEELLNYSAKDVESSMVAVDGPSLSFYGNERENAFWDHFDRTHPIDPEEIEREQSKVAADYGNAHKLINLSSNDVERYKESLRIEPLNRGYPAEAFTQEALYWVNVMGQRERYTKQIAPFAARRPSVGSNWLGRQSLDAKLVTQPWTEEQIAASNGWKISYLQRLRRENVDEAYVNAYLKAWNLTTFQVFGVK